MTITDNKEKLIAAGITDEIINRLNLKEVRNKSGYLRGYQAPEHLEYEFFKTTEQVLEYSKGKAVVNQVRERPERRIPIYKKHKQTKTWFYDEFLPSQLKPSELEIVMRVKENLNNL